MGSKNNNLDDQIERVLDTGIRISNVIRNLLKNKELVIDSKIEELKSRA